MGRTLRVVRTENALGRDCRLGSRAVYLICEADWGLVLPQFIEVLNPVLVVKCASLRQVWLVMCIMRCLTHPPEDVAALAVWQAVLWTARSSHNVDSTLLAKQARPCTEVLVTCDGLHQICLMMNQPRKGN